LSTLNFAVVRRAARSNHFRALAASTPVPIRALLTACALTGALLLAILIPSDASAAGVVGPNGQITGCYVKKGKAKGNLRVVPPGHRCRKGEKPLTFSAQGQSGANGTNGSNGSTGSPGQLDTITNQLTQLESRVTQLEGVLSGLTNSDLLGAIANASKLNGITALDLADAISAVPDVNALCTEVSSTVTQLNSIRTVLNGLSLTGTIPLGLVLSVPSIPSALSPFTCP
jgi:hypothetical protein